MGPVVDSLARFIHQRYPKAARVVEIGVGPRWVSADWLSRMMAVSQIMATDVDERSLRLRPRRRNLLAISDDVTQPTLPLYWGARVIYSVRPPGELLPSLEQLAGEVDADLLVVPLADETDVLRTGRWTRVALADGSIGWLQPNSAPPADGEA